jgi:hypothetical protein
MASGPIEHELETRLLHISSDDRVSGDDTTASFNVNLRNSIPELEQGLLHGVSVESVGFANVLPNVRATDLENKRSDPFKFVFNGTPYEFTIPGNTFYNIFKFAEAFDAGLNAPFEPFAPFLVTVQQTGDDGGLRLYIELNDDIDGPNYVITFLAGGNLAYAAGVTEDITIEGVFSISLPPFDLRTNLNGEPAIMLHTRELLGSRNSVEGKGRPTSAVSTIPITVPYGSLQSYHYGGDNGPIIHYGSQTIPGINNIDISFRYADGSVVDLQGTRTFVTFRLWMLSK